MKKLNMIFYPEQESFSILESIMALLGTLVLMALPLMLVILLITE